MHTSINWFEIPATDFQRATRFYETLFATELKVEDGGPVKMAIFHDASGDSCGCVAHFEQYQPSLNGTVIYLDAGPSIDQRRELLHIGVRVSPIAEHHRHRRTAAQRVRLRQVRNLQRRKRRQRKHGGGEGQHRRTVLLSCRPSGLP